METATGSTYYEWDAAGRMTSVENFAGTTAFTYNADGQRFSKTAPDDAITGYRYDGVNLLQETDDIGGDAENTYSSTTDQEFGDLISEDGDETQFHVYDAQMSTNALVDPAGVAHLWAWWGRQQRGRHTPADRAYTRGWRSDHERRPDDRPAQQWVAPGDRWTSGHFRSGRMTSA
jgi:YD repeat-containing protein